ncbi:hypothetical protein ACGF5O_06190 [Streptomyces sp. NPDC048291]|uniref:hypothetical protein n=1 Tax=Streptomyces sp. NPDC048291 TaxID=3365530 RepID=UPI0037221A46
MRKAIAAGALALVSAAGCLVLAPAASASANACVVTSLATGPRDGVGNTALKSATSSCSDLNLTKAVNLVYSGDLPSDSDSYAGRLYYTSTKTWKTCSAGYLWAADGSYAVDKKVLCSDVKDNAKFTVVSYNNQGDYVEITH